MENMLLWLGCAIIIGTIVLLYKQVETRMVLICAGILMCSISGDPMAAFKKFEESMTVAMLIKTICSVMGFAFVMKVTKCDAHLIHLLAKKLLKVRVILIPCATLITAFVNISLPSAAGVSAAVGAIVIPLLIYMGVRPAMAAAAVMSGSYGSMFSPGWPHNPFVAKMANVEVTEVIAQHWFAVLVTLLVGAASLAIIAFIRKEDRGFVAEAEYAIPELEKPRLMFAILPVLPVLMLMFSAYIGGPTAPEWGKALIKTIPSLKGLSVPAAMLIGAILGIALTRTNPAECSRQFFKGMGHGYADVVGIIIAAGVFVGGMHAVGLIDYITDILKHSEHYARLAAAIGPFSLAVITGSGDAATLAFNQAITPHAEKFGMTIIHMGALAAIAGSLGRTMSPLSGVAIICAGLAKVSPMEIVKRTAPGMLLSLVITILLM